jgi:hypothetical protein
MSLVRFQSSNLFERVTNRTIMFLILYNRQCFLGQFKGPSVFKSQKTGFSVKSKKGGFVLRGLTVQLQKVSTQALPPRIPVPISMSTRTPDLDNILYHQ